MTIDDFIDTYKSYSKDYRKQVYDSGYSIQQRDYSLSKAREYEQLAEWLEEYKAFKEGNYAKKYGKCPMCIDCPKNCPLDK